MAFTSSDLSLLEAAIVAGRGAIRIRFSDRELYFHTIEDMLKLRAEMRRDVAITAGTPRTRYAQTCKGV